MSMDPSDAEPVGNCYTFLAVALAVLAVVNNVGIAVAVVAADTMLPKDLVLAPLPHSQY